MKIVLERRTDRRWAPLILFKHFTNYNKSFLGAQRTGTGKSRNVLLVRDPRDVVVSFYYHVVFRSRGRPLEQAGESEVSTISGFLHSEKLGFRKILAYVDAWALWAKRSGTPIIHYEDALTDPGRELSALLLACGITEIEQELVGAAVAACTFDTMQAAERNKSSRLAGDTRLRRMRRGVAGGYRDEVSEADVAWMNDLLGQTTTPAISRYI